MKFIQKKALFVCVGVLATFSALYMSLWPGCDGNHTDDNFYREGVGGEGNYASSARAGHQLAQAEEVESIPYENIDCVINDEYSVGCRREGPEVYIPFYSFIQKYFEISGKFTEVEGREVFSWQHAYSAVYPPKEAYTPEGEFMSFRHYNVEVRERVKAINYEGVPISAQWNQKGYYYPIQIAQYGLSHYSKYLGDRSRTVSVLEDGAEGVAGRWEAASSGGVVESVYDEETHSSVVSFDSPDNIDSDGISHSCPPPAHKNEFTLSLDVRFSTNGSLAVMIALKGKQPQHYTLHYVQTKTLIHIDGNDFYYGIGDRSQWTRLTRDLGIDFQKAIAIKTNKKKAPKMTQLARVVSITLRGRGTLDNVTLASNAHLAQFYYAANWLVLHQDEQGGWPIMVTRKIAAGLLEMPPGWYSAMAQGQAISLLVRAYLRSHNSKYIDAALRATHLFDVASGEGGVRAMFAGKYPWYEEYPTSPSVFVLNGFMYSLIGLYDLHTVMGPEQGAEAERLYKAGITSLKQLLPLFDTGSGSIYDLRHFSLGSAPNLARWDYHTTHINQLLLLATVEEDPIYQQTAKRWISYMKGKRAPHN